MTGRGFSTAERECVLSHHGRSGSIQRATFVLYFPDALPLGCVNSGGVTGYHIPVRHLASSEEDGDVLVTVS